MKNLDDILGKIERSEPFALVRFGDGERAIINNVACNRKGFTYDPNNWKDTEFREQLIDSLEYKAYNYIVGVNDEELEQRVKSERISASIFINANYPKFVKWLPKLKDYKIILVANRMAKYYTLPFKLNKLYPIDNSAWRTEDPIITIDLGYTLKLERQPLVVLVAGGAYSCVLINRLWRFNQKHILLDVGSTLDPFFFCKKTRLYHRRLNND